MATFERIARILVGYAADVSRLAGIATQTHALCEADAEEHTVGAQQSRASG
jgi:hypothetical protein